MLSPEKLRQIVTCGGADAASYGKVKHEIKESNRGIVKGFSLLAYIVLGAMVILSLFVPTLSVNTPIYICGFVATLAVWLIAKYWGKDNESVMLADMYLFAALLLGLGIALGTVLGPKEISATYIAFLLTVPQVFTDRPYRMYILIVASVAVFVTMVITIKDESTWSSDITNAVLFGIISLILCTYSICNRVSKYCLQEQIRFLAENDQLTGLKNRYCYEMSLERASVLKSDGIYCVYVDVNGLHELNNTKGHEAGDRMLQYVASVMQHLFGEDNTYRIGGDEFVAIGMDRTLPEVEGLVASMRQAVESAGYHVAAGVSFRSKNSIEMMTVVKEAEQSMYADKANFYRQYDNDRRRR